MIEIDWDTKEIAWQYGDTDQPGDGASQLKEPNSRAASATGDTLIADAGDARVLRVSATEPSTASTIMKSLARPSWRGGNDPSSPRQAVYTRDGLLVVADSLFQQIVLLGYEHVRHGGIDTARLWAAGGQEGVRQPDVAGRHGAFGHRGSPRLQARRREGLAEVHLQRPACEGSTSRPDPWARPSPTG